MNVVHGLACNISAPAKQKELDRSFSWVIMERERLLHGPNAFRTDQTLLN